MRTGEALRAPALDPISCWRVEQEGGKAYVREKISAPAPTKTLTAKAPDSVVIIGGGAAGLAAADMLRREGFEGGVTLLSADDAPPCDRPNLSKDYLAGTAQEDWIALRPPEHYTEHRIELVLNTRVASLDVRQKRVRLENGIFVDDGARALTLTFDSVSHQLVLQCSDGAAEVIPLGAAHGRRLLPRADGGAAADGRHCADLDDAGRSAGPNPLRKGHDAPFVRRGTNKRVRHALVAMKPVLEGFRSGFVGKCSPVHFFWGSFDMAVTRFSGQRAPARAGADPITAEAYSHAVISHGFWPGSGAIQQPAFYAYAAPETAGSRTLWSIRLAATPVACHFGIWRPRF